MRIIIFLFLAFSFFQIAGCKKVEVKEIKDRSWGPWDSTGPFTFRCLEECSIRVVLQRDRAVLTIIDNLLILPGVAEIIPSPKATWPKKVVLKFNFPRMQELFVRTDGLILYVHPFERPNTIRVRDGVHHLLGPNDPYSMRLTTDAEGRTCVALPEALFTETSRALRVSWIP